MPADPSEPHLLPTLFSCHRPVHRYARLLARAGGGAVPEECVGPVDAFLMYQLVAFLPEPPQVIDLVAEATRGASTALWASHPGVKRVIAPRANVAGTPDRRGDITGGWRPVFEAGAGELGFDSCGVDLGAPPLDGPAAWDALGKTLDPAAPTLVMAPPVVETVEAVFAARPAAMVLLAGLGRLGRDPRLGPLLAWCEGAGARLTALRDLAPFFHASGLAVVGRGDGAGMEAAMERARQRFDGNFDFLGMARAVVAAAERERELAEDGAVLAGVDALSAGHAKAPQRAYRQAVERMQKLVAETVPARSTVVVVSRGDGDLLNLGGRRAWHFPQTEDGVYAGHHPADSAAAVAHLEALRNRGADVLMLPVTSFWWLRHYAGFARHLEENCELLARQDDACALYSLARKTGTPTGPTPAPQNGASAGGRRRGLWRWLGGGGNGTA